MEGTPNKPAVGSLAEFVGIFRDLIEPVLAAQYFPKPPATLIDIGSGGGSPAIPLRIVSPGISLVMVESKARKAAFLREAVRQLKLNNVTVEASRFEELLVRPELHELADIATLRAVRVERSLLDGIQAFLKPGGGLFLFRSGDPSGDRALSTRFLQYEASYVLLPHLQSRLVVLRNVPRGTS